MSQDHDDQAAAPDARYLAGVTHAKADKLTPSQKQKARRLLAEFLNACELNRADIDYTQHRPFRVHVDPNGFQGDCSSYVTQAFAWVQQRMPAVKLHDPNGHVEWDGYGYCHAPDARILTADLRWVHAGDIEVGQELWALDESPTTDEPGQHQRRRYRRAIVLASFLTLKDCVRVLLSTGEDLICTTDHPWLSFCVGQKLHRWRRADRLLHFNTDACYLVRPFEPWRTETSYEAGWLAGMFDGEGWVQNRSARGGRTSSLGATQVIGPTSERLVAMAQQYGDFNVATVDRGYGQPRINLTSNGSGVTGIAEFLGRIRPLRLIDNFELEGGEVRTRHDAKVVSVTPVGQREIQAIQTTTGTYFAEGFAVHNTGTLLATNHGHRIPLDRKLFVGDLAIYGRSMWDTRHVTICKRNGTEATALWSSHGSQAGPRQESLHYRSDLLGVYRPVSLL